MAPHLAICTSCSAPGACVEPDGGPTDQSPARGRSRRIATPRAGDGEPRLRGGHAREWQSTAGTASSELAALSAPRATGARAGATQLAGAERCGPAGGTGRPAMGAGQPPTNAGWVLRRLRPLLSSRAVQRARFGASRGRGCVGEPRQLRSPRLERRLQRRRHGPSLLARARASWCSAGLAPAPPCGQAGRGGRVLAGNRPGDRAAACPANKPQTIMVRAKPERPHLRGWRRQRSLHAREREVRSHQPPTGRASPSSKEGRGRAASPEPVRGCVDH